MRETASSHRATTAKQGLDWERVTRASMHPVQVGILRELMLGEASPRHLAGRLEQPVGNVSYHVRRLHALGLIELARTEPRRGAIEHFYMLSEGLALRN